MDLATEKNKNFNDLNLSHSVTVPLTLEKMSSSSVQQIRPVIECLCQILSLHGFSTITPEVFRLAKFNRDEAVRKSIQFELNEDLSHFQTVPLWRLLFELLHFDPTNSNCSSLIERFNRTGKGNFN